MSGHIKYEVRVPIYGRAGDDGAMVELGVLVIDSDATPADVNRLTADFYRDLARHLEEQAEELEAASG